MQPLLKDEQDSYLPRACWADKHPAYPVVNQNVCDRKYVTPIIDGIDN